MPRLNPNNTDVNPTQDTPQAPDVKSAQARLLDELIPVYYSNKTEMDSYKDLCDKENAQIKSIMLELGEDEYSSCGYTAKRIVQHKQTINEVKMLDVLKKFKVPGVIQTKEYVDMNALESYLFNNDVSAKLAEALESCKSSTEVVQLRVSETKKKKKADTE